MLVGRKKIYWTVVATRQPNSLQARRHLLQQNVEFYNPMWRLPPSRSGVRAVKSVLEYYLFVRVDVRSRWQHIRSTRGVREMFIVDGLPARIPDTDIEYFHSREIESGYFVAEGEEPPVFDRGQQVICNHPNFTEEHAGRYAGLAQSGGGRREIHRVIFTMLGREIEMQVPSGSLRAA